MSTSTSCTKAKKLEVMTLVNALTGLAGQSTMESNLLVRKHMRQLYRLLGKPQQEDFPDEFNFSTWWKEERGYTTYVPMLYATQMRAANDEETDFRIKRPSLTKLRIIERYARHGWHSTVYAQNVICSKYVPHPRYPGIWVRFVVSRDTARYSYILEIK